MSLFVCLWAFLCTFVQNFNYRIMSIKGFIPQDYLDNHIRLALAEDVGQGDYSSIACIDKTETNHAQIIVKQAGIICGLEIAQRVFEIIDQSLEIEILKQDGDIVLKGDVLMRISGKAISILTAERTALNYIQRLSGIATQTADYVKLIEGTSCRLLDTRKTTPTMRLFEKYAVKTAGAENHRKGLYDMIMLKDNHIDFAGGIKQAIKKTHFFLQQANKNLKIEIEVRDLAELKEVLNEGGVDRIMLDNFTPELLSQAVKLINHRYETESSGGITKETIKEFALTGVDYISVGALTHNIQSLDISLVSDK